MAAYIFPDNFLDPSGGSSGPNFPQGFLPPPLPDVINTVLSAPTAVAFSSHASVAHDPGAWVQIDAALSADASGVIIQTGSAIFSNGVDTSTILEIGIGESGSETVWSQCLVGYDVANAVIIIPGFIAAGTRIAGRVRSLVTNKSYINWCFKFLSAVEGITSPPTMFGFNIAASRGTVLPTPGANNTKGAWVELTDVTVADLSAVNVTVQASGDTTATTSILVDIGIGPEGAEVPVLSNMDFAVGSTESSLLKGPFCYGVSIPAGSRIAARYQATVTATVFTVALACA